MSYSVESISSHLPMSSNGLLHHHHKAAWSSWLYGPLGTHVHRSWHYWILADYDSNCWWQWMTWMRWALIEEYAMQNEYMISWWRMQVWMDSSWLSWVQSVRSWQQRPQRNWRFPCDSCCCCAAIEKRSGSWIVFEVNWARVKGRHIDCQRNCRDSGVVLVSWSLRMGNWIRLKRRLCPLRTVHFPFVSFTLVLSLSLLFFFSYNLKKKNEKKREKNDGMDCGYFNWKIKSFSFTGQKRRYKIGVTWVTRQRRRMRWDNNERTHVQWYLSFWFSHTFDTICFKKEKKILIFFLCF